MRHERAALTRARRAVTGVAMAAALIGGSGCSVADEILEVTDPDIINPGDVSSASGANAVRIGALGRFNTATTGGESMFLMGGLLVDEWRSSDTFTQRDETDRRTVQASNGNVTAAFRNAHRARLAAELAITALEQFEQPGWQIGQMYLVQAYMENHLAESFCSGIPFSTVIDGREQFGEPLSTTQAFERALEHADAAIAAATGTSAQAVEVTNAAAILKGRILVNLGRYNEAATAVADVATGFAWVNEHSQNTNTVGAWAFNNNIGRYFVGNGEGINGIDFVGASDPRIPTCVVGSALCKQFDTPVTKAFDNSTPQPLLIQLRWPEREADVVIISGVEARLIEAEALLESGSAAGALAKLNAARATVAGLDPLVDAGSDAARLDQLFRERAFWFWGLGYRLGDLRRLVRQYEREAEDVFPTGPWWQGGEYGTDVNFPVPQAEENNPSFAGCIDRNA